MVERVEVILAPEGQFGIIESHGDIFDTSEDAEKYLLDKRYQKEWFKGSLLVSISINQGRYVIIPSKTNSNVPYTIPEFNTLGEAEKYLKSKHYTTENNWFKYGLFFTIGRDQGKYIIVPPKTKKGIGFIHIEKNYSDIETWLINQGFKSVDNLHDVWERE